MSYCVNCGVELDPSAVKCALCSTPVYNPNSKHTEKEEQKPFSEKLVIPKNIQRKFVACIITMIMLIPNIVLFLVNIFFFRGSFWSVYVSSTCFLLWIVFVFPFITKKIRPYLMWAFDSVVGLIYSFIIVAISSGTAFIWQTIATLIGLISITSLFFIIWVRQKKRDTVSCIIHLLVDALVISIVSGGLTSYYSDNLNWFIAGLICSLCFASLLGFGIYCYRSKHMRAWIRKVFYF